MGVCQCNERSDEEKQSQLLTGSNSKKKFPIFEDLNDELAETKTNLIVARGGNAFMQKADSDFETEKPVVDENNSNSCINSFIGTYENKEITADREITPEEVPQRRAESPTSFIAEVLEGESELEFYEKSNRIFKLFNDIRSNPQNYETECDARLRNTLRQISEEPVDTILWSKKSFDEAFDFLNNHQNRKISTEALNDYLTQRANANLTEEEEKFKITTVSFYKLQSLSDLYTLFGLLTENLPDGKMVLTENYAKGFLLTIPSDSNRERVVLCLAQRVS